MDEGEEVFRMALPARDQAAEVVQPGKEPLHLPAPPIAAQRSAILSFAARPPVRRNQLDAVCRTRSRVGRRARPSRRPCRRTSRAGASHEEARAEHAFDETALRRASAFNRYGER